MASETSDLTFVRCPTCRSLVPASASRCRICNATLEAGGKASSDATAGAGRVRQKTVSASPDEVASILAASNPKPAAPPPPVKPAASLAATEDPFGSNDDGFDPLGAYLQDLESEPAQPPVEAKETSSVPADEIGGNLDDLDDFDLDIFDETPAEKPVEKVAAPPQAEKPPVVESMQLESDFLEPSFVEEEAPPPPVPPKQAAPPPQREEQRPQKQENRPNREASPAQKPQNPQPIRPKMAPPRNDQRFQAPKPREDRPAPKQQQPRGTDERDQGRNRQPAPVKAQPQQVAERQQPKPLVRENQPQREAQPPHDEAPSRHEAHSRQEEHPRREARESRRPHGGSGPKAGRIQPGRLFGWLVSFENPDGRAIELRGGRFFITGSNIRESDLILEDQSISTPHALMSITDRGLMIQDLMSERGTFIRSSGDSQYRREEGIIDVAHGDWVRFGDVEFLVVIVPSGD